MITYLRFIDPDQIAVSHVAIKVKLLILISFITTVWWVITNNETWWVNFLYFYVSLLAGRVFVEIGLHRFFSHKSFKTSEFKKNFLLIGGTLIGLGSCISYVGVHRTHHRYSDTPKDPHSPTNIGIIKTWLTMWDKNWVVDFSSVKDLLRDPLQMFLHRHYFKIIICWILLLSLISLIINSIIPLLLLFALPNLMTFITAGFTNAIGHTVGYRNFDTDDRSTNQYFTRFLLLSAGLHNNHHAYPNAWNFNVRKKWFEFDTEGTLIKHFFIKH